MPFVQVTSTNSHIGIRYYHLAKTRVQMEKVYTIGRPNKYGKLPFMPKQMPYKLACLANRDLVQKFIFSQH